MAIEIVSFARVSSEAQLEPQDEALFEFRVKNTFTAPIICNNVVLTFKNIPTGISIKEGITLVCDNLKYGEEVKKTITIVTNNPPRPPGSPITPVSIPLNYTLDIVPTYQVVADATPTSRTVTITVVPD